MSVLVFAQQTVEVFWACLSETSQNPGLVASVVGLGAFLRLSGDLLHEYGELRCFQRAFLGGVGAPLLSAWLLRSNTAQFGHLPKHSAAREPPRATRPAQGDAIA